MQRVHWRRFFFFFFTQVAATGSLFLKSYFNYLGLIGHMFRVEINKLRAKKIKQQHAD